MTAGLITKISVFVGITKNKDYYMYKNQNCAIVQNEQIQFEGIERGVDTEGHLLIESENKIQKVISGDVSLKAKP
jgi:biotin-(acetyl-CoA carboxylase) ligase